MNTTRFKGSIALATFAGLADTMIDRALAGGSGWGSTARDWCE